MKPFRLVASCLTRALLATCLLASVSLQAQQLLNPNAVPRFVSPLPIPSVIDATANKNRSITMTVSQFRQDLGLKSAAGNPLLTTVWGYNGQYPGPTILAQKDQSIQVRWLNRLVGPTGAPLPHLLPVDHSIAWTHMPTPGVPIATHLHGGHTESDSDGLPDAWYTPYAQNKGPEYKKGENIPYTYDNSQEAATLWYHDHTMGITRLNVYAGLAGFYLLTDGTENGLRQSRHLPDSRYDIGLAIQDRLFTADGQLFYPSEPEVANAPNPSVLPEFFGNIILVNGKAWPVLRVEPRQYRFRLLNASDSRFYNLRLTQDLTMWQVGSDCGLLPQPVAQPELLLAPGERKDVVIDFSNAALRGRTILITNDAATPYPDGDPVGPHDSEAQIMAFRVDVPLNAAYPLTPLPASFHKPLPPVPTTTTVRKLILVEGEDEYGRLLPMLGTMQQGAMEHHDPITENPALNSTEIWEIYNLTEDAHPVHLHLVSFRVLGSRTFTGTVDPHTAALSNVQFTGPLLPPEPGQAGLKDTYPIAPGQVTRLVATFDRKGLYAWHCHILSHEDHDMMRPFYVGKMPAAYAQKQLPGATSAVAFDNGSFALYPNPFATTATLELTVTEPAAVNVHLLDGIGRVVLQLPAQHLPTGTHQLEIDAADLNSGLYVCEVAINNKRYRQRLALVR
ncbi:multicopper oxidase domain-containing protein [Hymenobacter artigasi]|uniref:Spore coat protein A n=1 Tax=Hymenobacter artigasi TaxID=2719616 RepID=A0ABX1HKN6_9BACT|nr:multicopper oxidase domain-containing protein [Hymenobacter artigasi]NKI90807.1 spore coat protein A [Hymenobacter artigasi]